MARTNKTKKLKQATTSEKSNKKILKREPKSFKKHESPPAATGSSSSEPESDSIIALLEPYSKDQLIDLIAFVAVKTPSFYIHILESSYRDVYHQKKSIHKFRWDTTYENLLSACSDYGEIEECKLVVNKVSEKAKEFDFRPSSLG